MSQVSRRNRGDGRNVSMMMKMMVSCLVMLAFVGVDGAPVATSSARSFFATPQKGDYASVKQMCINGGGSIASIRSAAEDQQATTLCQTTNNEQCYIGFTDLGQEGTFRWDDNSAVGYTNWHPPAEPNNANGVEDCGTVNFGVQRKWNDVHCGLSFYGICQTSATLDQYTCPPGTYDKSPPTEPGCVCEECPAGHYCEGGENAGKEECHKGYFQPLKGQSACEPSPKGHKVPNKGSEHPTACPAGEYQDEEAQDECKPCEKGNYCPGTANENPTPCGRGTYQDEMGKDSCEICPKGNKCPGTGNEQPTKCWNGQYQDREGKQVCKDCPIGNKCAGRENENPTACEANTFQPCEGQEKCIPCEAPAVSGAGAGSCAPPTTL